MGEAGSAASQVYDSIIRRSLVLHANESISIMEDADRLNNPVQLCISSSLPPLKQDCVEKLEDFLEDIISSTL